MPPYWALGLHESVDWGLIGSIASKLQAVDLPLEVLHVSSYGMFWLSFSHSLLQIFFVPARRKELRVGRSENDYDPGEPDVQEAVKNIQKSGGRIIILVVSRVILVSRICNCPWHNFSVPSEQMLPLFYNFATAATY